jgi:hypothetical protein
VTFSIELEREDDGRWLAEVASVMCYGADRGEAVAPSRRHHASGGLLDPFANVIASLVQD